MSDEETLFTPDPKVKTPKKKATEGAMEGLHGFVAESFTDQIKRFRQLGEPIPTALLAAAARFLKDNHIDSPRVVGGKIDKLADEMPDLDADIIDFDNEKFG